jgi:RNA polymerase sigma-70 factor (ECF subfamily)
LGDADAARDALQEVFMRALRSPPELTGEASPMTWLYRVTTNYCLNQLRADRYRKALVDRNQLANPATTRDLEAQLSLNAVLTQVPEETREVAVCCYLDEMTQDETAAYLGVSRRTVGYRLTTFREHAQRLLEERRPECERGVMA